MAAMDRTRIAKVENVILLRRGEQVTGTLHLTPHHLIFVHIPTNPLTSPTSSASPTDQTSRPASKPRELWITYPIIALCTLRPSHPASRQPSSIRLRCRDFTFVCFYFADAGKARDVYESIKAWTCKLGRIEKLYAFTYQPQGREKEIADVGGGWAVYDPMREWRRMGVGEKGRGESWRISKINTDYAFSPTYPALLPVPNLISDNTLNYAGRYRSRARIPVLTYLHPVNNCSITRCSQPMLGVRQNRSIQDEKLLAEIFSTTRNHRPLSGFATPLPEREDSGSSMSASQTEPELHGASTEALEDAVISQLRDDVGDEFEGDEHKPTIYGAQQKNMIVDARPTVNALAMQAVGMGSENMDNYKFAVKTYLGIDNIHVMRDSLQKVIDTLKDSDLSPMGPSKEQLAKSGWLKHIANMLDGVDLIVRQVGLLHSHVLIHCSDGWDRTSQLSALSQICLDPYYRTFDGFMVLVEKDWLSFGHMFRYRSGFLSSEKWFHIENERIAGRDEDGENKARGRGDAMSGAQKTFENALHSARGFFTKQRNDSRESINVDSDADVANETDAATGRRVASASIKPDKEPVTKVKETAPIFHQFLDATYQLMYQNPTRFEFSERFLRRLLYHLYSCQYGTFLFDNEKDRKEHKISEKTKSVWDYFIARKQEFLNPEYEPEIDDNVRGQERLIFPESVEVRWWASGFGRNDAEMNGATRHPLIAAGNGETESPGHFSPPHKGLNGPTSRSRTPVLTGVETSEAAVGVAAGSEEARLRSTPPSLATEHSTLSDQSAENLMPPIAFVDKSTLSDDQPVIEVATSSEANPASTNLMEIRGQRPDSAGEQELLAKEAAEAAATAQMSTVLTEDSDPLGIGDVKDHIASSSRKSAQDRRRAHMEMLMQ